ncbi:MAG: nucleotidyltransferase domain-containing protein [Nanoarchaeota archaeon]
MPKKKNISKPAEKKQNNYDIAYDFATKVYQKFREVVKSIVLFGSVSKNKDVQGSDIDIIIVVDDASVAWDQELISWYREELGKLVASQKYNRELHINTVTLSAFWEEVKAGTPVIMNVIRYGQPLIDFGGFFEPLKVLLAKGRIRPTPEAVFTTLKRAPEHIARARFNILSSLENIYWAMVDSAHSALMAANQIPPSPEHIPEMLDDIFVKSSSLEKKYVDYYNQIYNAAKSLMHGETSEIKTEDIDQYLKKASEFEQVMRNITSKLIENEKIVMIERKQQGEASKILQENAPRFLAKQQNVSEPKQIEFPSYSIETGKYEEKIQELNSRNKQLSEQLIQLKAHIQGMQQLKKEENQQRPLIRDTGIMQLNKKVEQLQNQNDSLIGQIPVLKTQIQKLQETNKQLNIESGKLKSEVQKKEKTLEFPEFNTEVEILKTKNKEILGEIQKYKQQVQEIRQSKQRLADEQLQKQLTNLQNQVAILTGRNKELGENIPSLKKQIEELIEKNKSLLKKEKGMEFPEFDTEKENLQNENKKLFEEQEKTRKQLESYMKFKSMADSYKEEMGRLKSQIEDMQKLKKAPPEYSEQLKDYKDEIKFLQDKLKQPSEAADYKKRLNESQARVQKLIRENTALSKNIPSYKLQTSRLSKEINELKRDKEKLKRQKHIIKIKTVKLPLKKQELKKKETKINVKKLPVKKEKLAKKPAIKLKKAAQKPQIKKDLMFPKSKIGKKETKEELEFPDFK